MPKTMRARFINVGKISHNIADVFDVFADRRGRTVKIGCHEFLVSSVLKHCDRAAYLEDIELFRNALLECGYSVNGDRVEDSMVNIDLVGAEFDCLAAHL